MIVRHDFEFGAITYIVDHERIIGHLALYIFALELVAIAIELGWLLATLTFIVSLLFVDKYGTLFGGQLGSLLSLAKVCVLRALVLLPDHVLH